MLPSLVQNALKLPLMLAHSDFSGCGLKIGLSHSEPEFVSHGTTLLQEPRKPSQQEREGKVRPNNDNGADAYENPP